MVIRALPWSAALLLLGACSGEEYENGPLRHLTEKYYELDASQASEAVKALSSTDRLQLSAYAAFAEAVYFKACQSDASTVGDFATGQMTCGQMAASIQTTLSFAGEAGWQQNVETSRLSLLNALKCSSGEHDAASCGAYTGASAGANNASGQIGQGIIDSWPGYCDPNKDANCY
jgi:hypothetical protein